MGVSGVTLCCCVLFSIGGIVNALSSDTFKEELYIKSLPSGHVYSHFQFTTTWNVTLGASNSFRHFHLFPKSLGEILHKFSARELHLSLTQGRWLYNQWGYPVKDAAPGAELWVWFSETQNSTTIDASWMNLVNVLSGIFCASLNFMDGKATVVPKFGFRPHGVTTPSYDRWFSSHVRYAVLPRENVCTENLTPWKKLLPCGSKAGLSTLLNAARLYESAYHSVAVDFRPTCLDESCQDIGVELSQTVSIVFDPVILSQNIGSSSRWDWSLKRLFGRTVVSSCPVASKSVVYVDVGTNNSTFNLQPEPHRVVEKLRGSTLVKYAVYDVVRFSTNRQVLNVEFKYNQLPNGANIPPPALSAHRFQSGHGQIFGGIVCFLYNNHPTSKILISYQEVIPWFVRMYLHTLKIETFTKLPERTDLAGVPLAPVRQHYVPGRDRQRSYHLELILELPANSVTRLSFDIERQLLKWTEYPPDANHGFYIGSAVISALLPDAQNYTAPGQNSSAISSIFEDTDSSAGKFFVRLHTETLLITLPTPDFSMPYNVICLACTVLAIAFGSMHNLTTRRFVVYDPLKRRGLVTKLRERLTNLVARLRGKKPEEPVGTENVVKCETTGDGQQSSTDDAKSEDTSQSGVTVEHGKSKRRKS